MKSLSVDLTEKIVASGLATKHICTHAGVSPATITKQRAGDTNCGQRVYDRMLGSIIVMIEERKQAMAKADELFTNVLSEATEKDSLLVPSDAVKTIIDAYGFSRKSVKDESGLITVDFAFVYKSTQKSHLKPIMNALKKMNAEREKRIASVGL